mmetsp:Transcript_64611/g.169157  ORF Transcript_64611/g.169157 Transcript_64611/m.169157 type:complete len:82 (-) Transcript_64611:2-247(-)
MMNWPSAEGWLQRAGCRASVWNQEASTVEEYLGNQRKLFSLQGNTGARWNAISSQGEEAHMMQLRCGLGGLGASINNCCKT